MRKSGELENYELKKKCKNLSMERIELKEAIKYKDMEIRDKNDIIENSQNEIKRLIDDVSQKEKLIGRYTSSKKGFHRKIGNESEIPEYIHKIEELRGVVEEKQKLIDNREEYIKKLENENIALKKKLKRAEDQIQSGPSTLGHLFN